jgi:phage/plasmid-like protein (TIGR03299 family)
MPAEVETMMYAGAVPWHGFGTYVGEDNALSEDVLRLAGLDWGVEKRPLLVQPTEGLITQNVESHRAIVRTSDQSVLGIVGKGYSPLQNAEAVSLLDDLVGKGLVKYHTAGALRGGKRIWLLAKVDSYDVVGGDRVDEYLLLWNSHDGSSALRVLWTKIRVVCTNTASAALAAGKGQGLTLRHTRSMKSRLAQAHEVLGISKEIFQESRDVDRMLAKFQMGTQKWDGLLDHMFAIDPDATKASHTYAMNRRSELTELFENGVGQNLPGVSGTGWAAYNALTEYANFHRSTRGGQERRFESAISGSGAKFVQRGTKFLVSLAS